MSISKLYLIVLLGTLVCTATARDLSTTNDKHVNVKGVSTSADAADSKIDASVGTLGLGTPGTPGTRDAPGAPGTPGTPCGGGQTAPTTPTVPTTPGWGTPGTPGTPGNGCSAPPDRCICGTHCSATSRVGLNVKGVSAGADAADSKIDASVGTLGLGTPGTPGTRSAPGAPGTPGTPCPGGGQTAPTTPTVPTTPGWGTPGTPGTPGNGCSSNRCICRTHCGATSRVGLNV